MAGESKTNVHRLLDAAGVGYQAHFYDVSDGALDGVTAAARLGFPAEMVFKTLVTLASDRSLAVFVIPVESELDLKKAAAAAGVKSLAMLPLKELLKTTGYVHGGCSPLGMKRSLPTYIQEDALLLTTMVCSAGKVGCQMELAPDDLLNLCGGTYADVI